MGGRAMREFEEATAGTESARRREPDDHPMDAALGRAAAAGRPEAAGQAGILRLQRQVGNTGTAAMMEEERSPVHDVVASGGEPLDRGVRADMEATMGQDFSDVRVHRDSAAHESAQAVQAKAYTVGSHVVFQRDAFDPGSDSGRHVLAHELTHVVQQRSGPVEGTSAPGGIKVSDPSDRFEQEASQVADAAMAHGTAPAPSPAASSVQREAAPEEEEVQGYVQRHEDEQAG
ncbi:MAG TPA: DUF4157 domain-containing protein [Dermatophilaceae bacterium]|nr:DUF4157 domain-containing protein [Dermatophilaceae bacterium]